jgi:hypothetical protein
VGRGKKIKLNLWGCRGTPKGERGSATDFIAWLESSNRDIGSRAWVELGMST